MIPNSFKNTKEAKAKSRPGIMKKAPFSYSKAKIREKRLKQKYADFANNLVYAGKCGSQYLWVYHVSKVSYNHKMTFFSANTIIHVLFSEFVQQYQW